MSLLMEALRMAEQAKQKAAAAAISPTRPDDDGASPAGAILEASDTGLQKSDSDELAIESSPEKELMVELGTEDVMVVDTPVERRESASMPAADEVKPRAESEAGREAAGPESKPPAIASVESSRRTARTVFAAKKEYQRQGRNRRLRVLGGVGGLAVVGLAVFFFYIYRSMAIPVTSLPVMVVEKSSTLTDSGEAAVEPETMAVTGGASSPADSSPDSAVVPMPTGTPLNDLPSPVLPPVPSPSQELSSVSDVTPVSAGEAAADPASNAAFAPEALPEETAHAPIVITRRTLRPQASLLLTSAYSAYQKGEFPLARNRYQQVLEADPKNRGALLGLAAIALQGRETSLARDLYLRLLDQDPGDPLARAGMLAIAPAGDLVQQESELKLLLKQYPGSAPLLFSLGNIYAAGQRWSEAQQVYFEALRQAGNDVQGSGAVHPDYLFNMAVSLEHLGQMKPAVRYYQEALQLAAEQTAGFDPEALRVRLKTFAPGAAP